MATRADQLLRKLILLKKSSLYQGAFLLMPDELDEAIDAVYRLTELER